MNSPEETVKSVEPTNNPQFNALSISESQLHIRMLSCILSYKTALDRQCAAFLQFAILTTCPTEPVKNYNINYINVMPLCS